MSIHPPVDEVRTDRGSVSLRSVSKTFGAGSTAKQVLSEIDLTIGDGEFVCLLGRSGCGKSTLLSLIAGLQAPTSGLVHTGGRRIGMMFQDANLFPWLTVRGNIELALRLSGVPRRDFSGRVDELLESVRLTDAGALRPHELSGGMRQRVALARTLAQDCSILLMDEPFGALDAMTRDAMHDETERIVAERSLTVLFVTHNVSEAARLADRVIIMAPSPGRIHAHVDIELPRPRRSDTPELSSRAAVLRDSLQGSAL
ncbi:MAG: ABC transporter ATP-binding protein [Actinomycetales bacterium]